MSLIVRRLVVALPAASLAVTVTVAVTPLPRPRARPIAVSAFPWSLSFSVALAPFAICLVADLSLNRLAEPRTTTLPLA
ncbi:MAG TPA: hypothetical protein VFM57_16975, partial [Thermoleophilaceae bacterium]|nr:hypothetical protein [Thermoleophilaceae bacterium]